MDARLPCPSPTPAACWSSCPSSRWCHSGISSSVVPFSSCPQSLPASGSFPMSQLPHEILVSQIYCLLIYIVYVYMCFIYQKCNIILYSRVNSYLLGSPSAHWECIVQFSRSVVSDSFATPWIAARQLSLSITNSRSLLKLMSIELVIPSNHLIICHPLLLPSVFPSIKVFSIESILCIR